LMSLGSVWIGMLLKCDVVEGVGRGDHVSM